MAVRWQVYLADVGTPEGSDYEGNEYVESRTLIYDSNALNLDDELYKDKYIIYNPVLTRQANEAGSFECDIPSFNHGYDRFETYGGNTSGIITTYISVWRDEECIWQGRVISIDIDFDLNKHIYAEGEMAFYNDFQIKINWSDYIASVNNISVYNPILFFTDVAQIPLDVHYGAEGKIISPAFTYGQFPTLTTTDIMKTTNATTDNTGDVVYMSRWEALKDNFLDGLMKAYKDRVFMYVSRTQLDSILFRRKLNLLILNEDGSVLYGNAPTTSQKIEFGKNLTDITVSYAGEDIYTAIHIYGYETKGWWIFETTTPIDTVQYNLNLVAQYGWIEKTISIDGESSSISDLEEIATQELDKLEKNTTIVSEIAIKAIDLMYAGEANDHLDFMKRTHIISESHGIDGYYLCTKTVEYLDDPSRNEYVFGRTGRSSSQRQASSERKTNKSYDISRTTKSYVVDS